MTSTEAQEITRKAADFISQMVRLCHLPKDRRAEACDHAIDLNRLSQAHEKAAALEAPPAETDPPC